MSDFVFVNNDDQRYRTLQKGFNLRFPPPARVRTRSMSATTRSRSWLPPTTRWPGLPHHGAQRRPLLRRLRGEQAAEDHGKSLAIIDIGLVTGLRYSEAGDVSSPWNASARYKFSAAAGNQNWDGYVNLYKSANRTLPGGSCYSVGAGGHIVGGGYGLLSRLQGLTVDWLSGVDILVPKGRQNALVAKHVNLASVGTDRDLFIACRGGGGGNYGIILNYYFAELPVAPQQAYWLSLSYPWASFGTGATGKAAFGRFMKAYYQWFADNDADWNSSDPAKANGGLFTLLKVQHRSTGDIVLNIQYTGTDGKVGGARDQPFINFVNAMNAAAATVPSINIEANWLGPTRRLTEAPLDLSHPVQDARLMDWLWLTQNINGSAATSAASTSPRTTAPTSPTWKSPPCGST